MTASILALSLRAGIQAVLAILMIDLGNVYLDHLGQILGPFQLTLGSIGLIITVFATIAIINAFNMIDGYRWIVRWIVNCFIWSHWYLNVP